MSSIEGILLRKTPFRDKDLICSFLTRRGRKVSILFYGVQNRIGKNVCVPLEIGNMFRVMIKTSGRPSDLKSAKEWDYLWRHESISKNYKTYCNLCLMLEICSQVALEESFDDDSSENEGLFLTLSNGIYLLDKFEKEQRLNIHAHMFMYFARLMQFHGIFPVTANCIYCDKVLISSDVHSFIDVEGGFSCKDCNGDVRDFPSDQGIKFWREIDRTKKIKFEESYMLDVCDQSILDMAMNYLASHEVIKISQLKCF